MAALAVLGGQAPDVRDVAGPSPTATATLVIAQSSPTASATEPGTSPATPSPTLPPDVDRAAETSAPVSPPPPATPWPTPDPAIWRYEGAIVDEKGAPLKGVCIAIGPRGCVRGSIRTDDNGRYYVDMPQNATIVYEFTFMLDGYEVVWHRAQPSGPTVFNVILHRLGA